LKVVIDTSIVIAVLLNEENKSRIIEITTGAELFAPASLHWEIGNAFSAMFRRNRITFDEAVQALKYYQEIPIRFLDIDLEKALKISDVYSVYAYDSYFIAACKEINSSLISLDNSLIEIASNEGINILKV
jgi:predicted nucleic acid-binding protein